MTYTGTMVLPSNAVKMKNEEMEYLEGGDIKLAVTMAGYTLWVFGTGLKATTRYCGRVNGKEVYMTWNPSKKTIKIGNVLCAVGSVMAGEGNKNVGRIFGAATIISATRS